MRALYVGGALLGVLLGIGLGLIFSWMIWPTSYVQAEPADLALETQDDYIRMIAATYSLNGDMARALQGLGALGLSQPQAFVASRVGVETKPLYQQALIHLALDLSQADAALARPTFTPRPTRTRAALVAPKPTIRVQADSPTPTPFLTPTPPEPTPFPPTALPNMSAPAFELAGKDVLTCAEVGGRARLEVQVRDENGAPVAGVGLEVYWPEGDEILFTGLKPERGVGYAALEVKPGNYLVRLTDTARSEVTELQVEQSSTDCASAAMGNFGWRLTYVRRP